MNDQELRHATYWGPFIRTIQAMADDDPFWADSGVFTANDIRRMLDHEFISELATAFLHGPQNKKDKLETYYQLYEDEFEAKDDLTSAFRLTTGVLSKILPDSSSTRWKKKSDFYVLFLMLSAKVSQFPFTLEQRQLVSERLHDFGAAVTTLLKLDVSEWEAPSQNVADYARAVSRAASDRANRVAREAALASFVFSE